MKIGRNDPCPCGSLRKYKKCCGDAIHQEQNKTAVPADTLPAIVRATIGKKLQEEELRIARFGDVRAPISQNFAGQTFVAVGSRLLANPKWKSFHDFLFSYIVSVVEKDWFRAELDRRLTEQHPLVQWYHRLHDFQRRRYKGFVDGSPRGTHRAGNGVFGIRLRPLHARTPLPSAAEARRKA
jgi:hypothetical protein